jgi:hypothetical protein
MTALRPTSAFHPLRTWDGTGGRLFASSIGKLAF